MVSIGRLSWVRQALKAAQGVLALATAWTVILMIRTDAPVAAHATAPTTPVSTESPSDALQPLKSYAPLWRRDLRQPPVPPASERAARPVAVANIPLPQLLGTFMETTGAFAQFRMSNGKTRVCAADDILDDCRIVSIETGKALLEKDATHYWVEIPRRRGDRGRTP